MTLKPITILNRPDDSPLKGVLNPKANALVVKALAYQQLVTRMNVSAETAKRLLGLPQVPVD